MRLKSYLLIESNRTKEITEYTFMTDIHKKCSDIINTYRKQEKFYYRGISNLNYVFGFVQPSKFTRTSAYATYNAYTLVIDNSGLFKGYPKRSKSIVMTTNYNDARGRARGVPYMIFPVNGANIGVCSFIDIWYSFPALFKRFYLDNLNSFNIFMENLNSYIGKGQYNLEDWKSLKKLLSLVPEEEYFEKYTNDWKFNDKEKLWDQIIPYFDPKLNGFQKLNPKSKVPSNKECWTDADCYLLGDLDLVDEILEKK